MRRGRRRKTDWGGGRGVWEGKERGGGLGGEGKEEGTRGEIGRGNRGLGR